MKILVEWLSDEYDCDICGPSWAGGAIVKFEDGKTIEMILVARCCGSTNYEEVDVYKAIFDYLGHEFEVVY
jgi:hypothetical protein